MLQPHMWLFGEKKKKLKPHQTHAVVALLMDFQSLVLKHVTFKLFYIYFCCF